MRQISSCHNKQIVRGATHGRPVCSVCGAYCGYPKKKRVYPVPMEKKDPRSEEWLEEPKTPKAPDTRNFIRHFSDAKTYTVCHHKGFRTTDVNRVNCMLCMRTAEFKEAVRKKSGIIS